MTTVDHDSLLLAEKAALRKSQSSHRNMLKEHHPLAAQSLAEHAAMLISWATDHGLFDPAENSKAANSKVMVAGYWPIRSELDPRPLMSALINADDRMATCLPATPKPETPLRFHQWRMGDTMIDGLYGTSEPASDAPVVIPHLILAPLLAYDQSCYRLGYGGGFYDRTLADIRQNTSHMVKAVGIAYAGQHVISVPRGEYDAALDAILTEQGLIEPKAAQNRLNDREDLG